VPVTVKLRDGESVSGWIEYFDDRMIRLTREGRPNLFIYKQQIRTITEQGRRTPKNAGQSSSIEDARDMRRD
jgi:host factor-I protein